MKIGIIAAMSSEYKQVAQLLEDKKEYTEGMYEYTEGKIKNNIVILTKCGIGKVNAAVGAVELIRTFQPDCIISTGVAGGIDKCLKVMDVVASAQIVYHDVWCGEGNAYGQIQGMPTFFEGNKTLFECAISLDTETPIHGGLICSGDKFITDREELDVIKGRMASRYASLLITKFSVLSLPSPAGYMKLTILTPFSLMYLTISAFVNSLLGLPSAATSLFGFKESSRFISSQF